MRAFFWISLGSVTNGTLGIIPGNGSATPPTTTCPGACVGTMAFIVGATGCGVGGCCNDKGPRALGSANTLGFRGEFGVGEVS